MSSAFLGNLSSVSQAVDHVVINEFEANPYGPDEGNEWVELYNPTLVAINLSGWRVSARHGEPVTAVIEGNTIMQPLSYHVVTYASLWLDNKDEYIVLIDSLGNEVDRTPVLSDNGNDSRTWSRFPNGKDTDSVSDWRFQGSTEGFSNGEESVRVASSVSISLSRYTADVGQSITVSGSVSPPPGQVQVFLTYTRPDNNIVSRTVLTSADGQFSDSFAADTEGTWSVKAEWAGNVDYVGASSLAVSLIAVAPFPYLAVLAIPAALAVAVFLFTYVRKPATTTVTKLPSPPAQPDHEPTVQIGRATDLFDYIKNARHDVKVVSPWISEDVARDMCGLASKKNLEFRVVTSPDTNVETHARALAAFPALSTPNVKVKILWKRKLHAKIIVVDDSLLIVGSANLTFYGLHENIEGYVVLRDAKSVKSALDDFNELWRLSSDLRRS
jgi:hypothetical protein